MRNVAIVGTSQTKFSTRRDDVTYPELVYEAAARALSDAQMSMEEIEAVVFSLSPEALFGIDAPERWCVGAAGALNKPFMRVNTGGATGGSAAQAGYFHLASGLFDTVLVVGAEKIGESPDAQQVLNFIWDPIYEKDIALNAINMCSFQAVRHMHRYGTTEEQMARVAVRLRGNGLRNPYAHIQRKTTLEEVLSSRIICWPIKLYEACPRSSGACALIMASEERVKGLKVTRPAWIRGVGATTHTYYMGDKMGPRADTDHADWDELAQAAARAYRMAGITNPQKEIDVAEVYAPFSSTEIAAVEALGFCQKGEGGRAGEEGMFDMEGEVPVSPSGGVLCANPIAVTALVRVAEAAVQIMGKAGEKQVRGAKRAVATGVGGSVQFHTAMVLSSDF